jgi:hypothetical protein
MTTKQATDGEGRFEPTRSLLKQPSSIAPQITASAAASLPSLLADEPLTVLPQDSSLLTDLYQLTMTACYVGEGLDQRRASFELFARRLPAGFGYLVAMGLAQALDYLERFAFNAAQIEALQASGIFTHAPDRFWSLLATLALVVIYGQSPKARSSLLMNRCCAWKHPSGRHNSSKRTCSTRSTINP